MLKSLFTDHPASVGETYGEHMVAAGGFGLRMILCGIACLVHSVLPFLFVKTASRTVDQLYRKMVTHRSKAQREPEGTRVTI